MMLDPLILKAISIGLGLMFLAAGIHKLGSPGQFGVTLLEYQVMPAALVAPMTRIIPIVELLLGGAWLAGFQGRGATAIGSALLLGIYAAAIGVNMLRGRIHFDCGCGFGRHGGGEQYLSGGLILRNLVLIAASLLTLAPVEPRALRPVDYLTLVAALIAGTLLFAAANQLLANRAEIDTWRKGR